MSTLNGLFSLRTPRDLLEKLDDDFRRLHAAAPASRSTQFAAFDFFATAHHLSDWLSEATRESLPSCRNYPEGKLVEHLAVGIKHFVAKDKRHKTVQQTGVSQGAFDPAVFDSAVFDTGGLYVLLEDGSSVDVFLLAKRVRDHWHEELGKRYPKAGISGLWSQASRPAVASALP